MHRKVILISRENNTLTPTVRQASKISENHNNYKLELKEFDENTTNPQALIKNNQDFVDHYTLHQVKFKREFNEKEVVVEFHGKVIRIFDFNVNHHHISLFLSCFRSSRSLSPTRMG